MNLEKVILSIIIVNYNTKALTINCIASIERHLKSKPYEIIVVDNNSKDDSVYSINSSFPSVKVIKNTSNKGFGAANNIGAKNASGEYILFLNSDTYLINNSIFYLLDFMENNKAIGIAGPKLLLEDEKTEQEDMYGNFPTIFRLILRKTKPKVHFIKNSYGNYALVDWYTGAALMIRKSLFDKINGFDEKIFMYYEDVDLCKRVKEKGYHTAYYPGATIVHLKGRSLLKNIEISKHFYDKGMDIYFAKHFSCLGLPIMKILRFLYRYFISR